MPAFDNAWPPSECQVHHLPAFDSAWTQSLHFEPDFSTDFPEYDAHGTNFKPPLLAFDNAWPLPECPDFEHRLLRQTSPGMVYDSRVEDTLCTCLQSPLASDQMYAETTELAENCLSPRRSGDLCTASLLHEVCSQQGRKSAKCSRPKTKTIGVPHPNTMKLTALDAIAIFQHKLNKTPGRAAQVGLLYKVSAKTVRDIWTQKTWQWATFPISSTLHQPGLQAGGGREAGGLHHKLAYMASHCNTTQRHSFPRKPDSVLPASAVVPRPC